MLWSTGPVEGGIEMKNTVALMALLLLASVAVSSVVAEPLLAKTKPHEDAATTPFNFQSTSGTANLTSNRETSYPATLTLSGVLTKTQQNKWLKASDGENESSAGLLNKTRQHRWLKENDGENESSAGELNKTQQRKLLSKIDITGGTLTIDGGYYAAKVYEIMAGSGIYNEKNSKVQITCKVKEVPSGSTYVLVLHGKKTPNGFIFQAPKSKLVGQYFLQISGQLQ